MKDFWKFFIFLVLGAVINLAGGLIGKTTLGYLLFSLGLIIVIVGFVLVFIKKSYFKEGRLKVLILGLVLSILLASSITLLVNNSISRSILTGNNTSLLSQMPGVTGRGTNGFSPNGNGSFGTGNNGTSRSFSGQNGSSGTFSGQNSTGTGTNASGIIRNRIGSMVAVILGWVFLVSGLILLLIVVIRLLRKKTNYKGDRWKVLLLGLLVGAMLSSSTALLLTKRTIPANFAQRTGLNGQAFSRTPQASAPGNITPVSGVSTTETPAYSFTPEPSSTPEPTRTLEPSATATVEGSKNLVVCLNYNIQVGINVRNYPSDTGTNVGTIPAAGCFTIDGKNSQHAGWYHLASGQNGLGGITIRGNANDDSLWINGKNLDASETELNSLAEIEVSPGK